MEFKHWLAILALSASVVGCGGEEATEVPDEDNDNAEDTDVEAEEEEALLEPVAVGFELDAIHLTDHSLRSYNITMEDNSVEAFGPSVFLTFADAEYFAAQSEEDKEGHYCIAIGSYEPTVLTTDLSNKTMGEGDAAQPDDVDLYLSYEGELVILGHTCDNVGPGGYMDGDDPVWQNGDEMIAKFDGMRLGIGFGAPTQYIIDAYTPDAPTEEDQAALDEFFGKYAMTEYIAIYDADGGFEAYDWSTARLFEWDATTETLKSDADGYLMPIDISGSAGVLPEGYIRSSAFWYQDFTTELMNFDNLADAAN